MTTILKGSIQDILEKNPLAGLLGTNPEFPATETALTYLVLALVTLAFTSKFWFFQSQRPPPRAIDNTNQASGTASSNATAASSATASYVPLNKSKGRQFGEWIPEVGFSYPPFAACTNPIAEIKPIPYRPFRWGAYHVTMGIRSMPWGDWIELDRGFKDYHRIKQHRIDTRGKDAVRVLEEKKSLVAGGAVAAVELVHELAEYLCRRYPRDFSVVRRDKRRAKKASVPNVEGGCTSNRGGGSYCDWGWDGLTPIHTITILALDETHELPISVDDGEDAPGRAMKIAGLLIQDDLAIMMEGSDGKYYFQAGSICLPGFWRLRDKIGMPLEEIHHSGDVPQYRERLEASLERFFQRLGVDKPVIRNNYFIQRNRGDPKEKKDAIDPDELAWAGSTLGAEDGADEFKVVQAPRLGDDARIEEILLRTERQTLRRLRYSGGVVFTIRTYLVPLVELAQEPGVAGRLASALRSWPEDVGEYKGKGRGGWFSTAVSYLEGIEIIHEGEEGSTDQAHDGE